MRQRELYGLTHFVEVDRNGFYTLSTLNGLIRRQTGDAIGRSYKDGRAFVVDLQATLWETETYSKDSMIAFESKYC